MGNDGLQRQHHFLGGAELMTDPLSSTQCLHGQLVRGDHGPWYCTNPDCGFTLWPPVESADGRPRHPSTGALLCQNSPHRLAPVPGCHCYACTEMAPASAVETTCFKALKGVGPEPADSSAGTTPAPNWLPISTAPADT